MPDLVVVPACFIFAGWIWKGKPERAKRASNDWDKKKPSTSSSDHDSGFSFLAFCFLPL